MNIHFAHANGFPCSTYRVFFDKLQSLGANVFFKEMLAHDESFPLKDSWDVLIAELIHHVEHKADHLGGPLIGVGHSLGGVLTYHASTLRPDLFNAVIMLDAPLLTRLDCVGVKCIKRLGMVDRITPAGRSLGRRSRWDDHQQAVDYFSKKALFRSFDERCLQDYVHFGTLDNAEQQGISLKYDPATEVRVFRTFPDDHVAISKVPSALIYGQKTKTVAPRHRKMMASKYKMQVISHSGGHLFPFEFPEAAAANLIKTISDIQSI